jgi:hypothetical protein
MLESCHLFKQIRKKKEILPETSFIKNNNKYANKKII